MSSSSIEDLIKSAKNKENPISLRKNWVISAKSKIQDAKIDIELIEIEFRQVNQRGTGK